MRQSYADLEDTVVSSEVEYTAQKRKEEKRKGKSYDLEVSASAAGYFIMAFGVIWLIVGYSIPYYRENGLMAGFWLMSLFFIALGYAVIKHINSD